MSGYNPDNKPVHELAERLVKNEIHLNVSIVVERLLYADNGSDLTGDYYEALSAGSNPCEECGECTGFDGEMEKCPDNCENPISPEVFEYYAVSNSLARELKAQGEVVLDDCYGLTIWGRTCAGQSILLDGTMQDIAADLIERTKS